MAIYDYKEFLTLDDLVDYLRDKGVYDFDLSCSRNIKRLQDYLIDLVNNKELIPVFYYDGIVRQSHEIDDGTLYIKAWICINYDILKKLFDNEKITLNINDYLKVFKLHNYTENSNIGDIVNYELDGYIFMDTNRCVIETKQPDFFDFDEDNPLEGYKPKNPTERRMEAILEILDDIDKKKRENPNIEINLDDYKYMLPKTRRDDVWLNFSNLLYPKIQLDRIFNPVITDNSDEKTTLQQQLQEAQARIKELESTQNAGMLKGLQKVNHDTERTRKFAQIIAKAIWDMDKTQAIRTNDMVQFLKPLIAQFEPSKLPDSDETVSYWLADIKPLHATKSGRPPKNELLEIPLTFKK